MIKQRKAYEIRVMAREGAFSKSVPSRKLFSRTRALRIVRFLKKRGILSMASPMMVDASAKIAA